MSIYIPIFRSLNQAKIRYVVVGGLATVLHGYGRLTADIDLMIDLDQEEAKKTIKLFTELGLAPRVPVDPLDFADAEKRKHWIEVKSMQVFSLWNPEDALISVDLFVNHPIEFEGLWSRAEAVDIGGEIINIASIPDLIELKRISNRPQDLEGIRQWRLILNLTSERRMSAKSTGIEKEDWHYSWEDHQEMQLRGWLQSSHQQRLAWLEEAIKLAHKSGALPKNQTP